MGSDVATEDVPIDPDDQHVRRGRFTRKLLEDSSWIQRRVETVAFIDNHTLERRVTLDISRDELAAIATTHGLDPTNLNIPVGVFTKNLLLEIDLKDGNGDVCQVVPSQVDADAGVCVMLAALRDDCSVELSDVPSWARKMMLHIAKSFPSVDDRRRLVSPSTAEPVNVDMWTTPAEVIDEADARWWRSLIDDNDPFWSLLVNFSLRFMLMTKIDSSIPGVTTLKFRYIEDLGPPKKTFLEWIGLRTSNANVIPASGFGMGRSEHLQFSAPEGMLIANAAFWKLGADVIAAETRRASPKPETSLSYEARVTAKRGSIYASKLAPGAYWVAFFLHPNPRVFLGPASYSILMSGLLVLAGAIFDTYRKTLSESHGTAAEAAIVLLLAVPTIASAFLVSTGEHEMLSDISRAPRFLTAITAVVVLTAGGGLIVEVSGQSLTVLWYAAAGFCLAVFALFRVQIAIIKRSFRQVSENARNTESYDLLEY